jgi:uncharacterized repeat protein (TIGR02543 family)
MKALLYSGVAICAYFSLLVQPAQAQFSYTTNADNTITVTGYTGPPWAVTIPTNINGLLVTSIGTNAFAGLNLASVTIPGSVTSIGEGAFESCTSLTNVNMTNGFTIIGPGAFLDFMIKNKCQAATYLSSLGDSTGGAGSYLPSVTDTWASILAVHYSWPWSNYAVAAYCLGDGLPKMSPLFYTNGGVISFDYGINDYLQTNFSTNAGTLVTSNSVPFYFGREWLGCVCLLELGTNKITAGLPSLPSPSGTVSANTNGMTFTGTWYPANTYYYGWPATNFTAMGSLNTGATAAATVYGTSVIVGATTDGYDSGGFLVAIDGTNYGVAQPGYLNGLAGNDMEAAAFIYTNFPPGFHNVVVTVTNSGGGRSTLDYIASADQAVQQAPVILAGNVIYPTNWTSGGSPAQINAFNAVIFNDCQTLRYVGFPVALVDISTICMPFTNTGYANNLHPGVAANVAEAQAFINAANATELSGSISNIGPYAFQDCHSLASVTIPNSVTSIGSYAFSGSGLTSVCFEGNAPTNSAEDVFESDPVTAIFYVSGATGWGSNYEGIPTVLCTQCGGGESLQVTITPAGAITAGAQWQVDGGAWQNSGATVTNLSAGSHTVSLSTISGYAFTDWNTNGIVASTSSSYTFTLINNVTLVANFTPLYTYKVTASPSNGGTVSAGGTNGGGIFPAGSTNAVLATANSGFEFIGWTGDATGTVNPLLVTVNTNLNITANFAISTNFTLTVITNGEGMVTPNPNGKLFKTNSTHTLTATAASGNLFSNWTGSITTNKNPLTIKLESSMVLQANFIPNPFIPFVGTYNGLFWATNGIVAETNAGMLKGLALTSNGTYSGSLLINGASKGFSGSFDLAGQASKSISLGGQEGNVEVVMTLTSNNPAPQVTGMVSNAGWVATNLIADRATNTPLSAQYTLLIPPDTNSASSPSGYGYALITGSSGTAKTPATAKITGALADGTAFIQSAPLSIDGYVPIYANLYSSKGLLLGWINLTNASGMSLAWVHPAVHSGLFTGAFTSTNQIALSPWTNPPATNALPTNLVVVETTDNTPVQTNDFTITITNRTLDFGKWSGPATPLNGSIAPKTGLLKVTFGSGASKTTGYGVILLNGTNGGGYFLNKANAGAVILEP